MSYINHQTTIHLGAMRGLPAIKGKSKDSSKWIDIDDTLAIFFDDSNEIREFAEALMDAAEGFAP